MRWCALRDGCDADQATSLRSDLFEPFVEATTQVMLVRDDPLKVLNLHGSWHKWMKEKSVDLPKKLCMENCGPGVAENRKPPVAVAVAVAVADDDEEEEEKVGNLWL